MFTVSVRGIKELQESISRIDDVYRQAADDAIDFAHTTILNRVNAGQKVDGAYRESISKDPKSGTRYSEDYADFRSDQSMGTKIQNLKMTGGLHKNFKKAKRNDKGGYNRYLYFTNKYVKERKRNKGGGYKTVTRDFKYNELAERIERDGRISFKLSDSQMARVRREFRQSVLRRK